MKNHLDRWLVLITVWAVACSNGRAVENAGSDSGKTPVPLVKITLTPAAEPKPALKYHLQPQLIDRKPGNAAILYNKTALVWAERQNKNEINEQISTWLELPLDELAAKAAEAQKTLDSVQSILDDIDLAARRQDCDWELPLKERPVFSLLLPELQQLRGFARLVSLRTRLLIVAGKYDAAIDSLTTGYMLGRHAAQGPTLINALVGIAICSVTSQDALTLIQQPGAPNLYWALSSLPNPLIDLRQAMEAESEFLFLSFPELRNVEEPGRGVEYWQAFFDRLMDKELPAMGVVAPQATWRPAGTFFAHFGGYPIARAAMIAQGRPAAEVDAMPVAQVVLWYTVETFKELRDEMFKWLSLPYYEARTAMLQVEEHLRDESRKREIIPLAGMLLPALRNVSIATARNNRDIALLRTLEGLRLHAMQHAGQLPEKLSDITAVPIPIDPLHGKPFRYRKEGDAAFLESPAPTEKPVPANGKRLEIKISTK